MNGNYGVIYVVTNMMNNKEYIGQTKDFDKRVKSHLRNWRSISAHTLISQAIKSFGVGAFSFRQIYTAFSQEELDYAEDYFINAFDTMEPNGYNARSGGKGNRLSVLAKIRHHEATVAAMNRPEVIEKLRQGAIRQFADPEKRARHKAAYDNPDTRAKLVRKNIGRPWINNGTKNRRLAPNEEIPNGWEFGIIRTKRTGSFNHRWINNGTECRMIPINEEIPNGWIFGKIDIHKNTRSAGRRWINNGHENQMIPEGSEIPSGWRSGMFRTSIMRR
jgi:group I intron endonuclease